MIFHLLGSPPSPLDTTRRQNTRSTRHASGLKSWRPASRRSDKRSSMASMMKRKMKFLNLWKKSLSKAVVDHESPKKTPKSLCPRNVVGHRRPKKTLRRRGEKAEKFLLKRRELLQKNDVDDHERKKSKKKGVVGIEVNRIRT